MYPIRFKNVYYEKIWGGRDFETLTCVEGIGL